MQDFEIMDNHRFLETVIQKTDQAEILVNQSLSTNNRLLAFEAKIQLMEVMKDIVQKDSTCDLLNLQVRIMKMNTVLSEQLANYMF